MDNSTNATNVVKDARTESVFFKEECLYVEIDFINHPGLVKAMLLAGLPEGSRIVAKFADGDSRYEVFDLDYQAGFAPYYLPERYYLQASNHKKDMDDPYQIADCNKVSGPCWNAVIIPSNPDFSARLYIETDKVAR